MGADQIDLSTLSGKGVRVAIIDTGVDADHPKVGTVEVSASFVDAPTAGFRAEDQARDTYGHGTACAAIIRRLAPGCELAAGCVADNAERITPEAVAGAIEWAIDCGADVINISAGTTQERAAPALLKACQRAAEQRVAIVASESNNGGITYPAAFENVITVGSGFSSRLPYAFTQDSRLSRRFCAFGGHQKLAWLNSGYIFSEGSSFAAPRITGIIALLIEQFGRSDFDTLLNLLGDHSVGGDPAPLVQTRRSPLPKGALSSWIGRAALYPFSKEIQSLVRFSHLLDFEIGAVADALGRRKVGKDAGELIGMPAMGLRVSASLEAALETVDTLVLGFVTQLGRLRGRDIHAKVVRRALELGKKVYSFEPIDSKANPDLAELGSELRFHSPGVTRYDLRALRELPLSSSTYADIPILGVLGTSSNQGKFTIQLLLQEQLASRGFNVAQIGTEHQSELLGMDVAFPIGHVNNVHLSLDRYGEYFDLTYRRLARDRDLDIITIGTQGGVIPYEPASNEQAISAFSSIALLTAARIDSYILVVNHLDTRSFIHDTIEALRIYCHARPILLALSTRKRVVVESYGRRIVVTEDVMVADQERKLAELEAWFDLPAISILSEGGPQRLADLVVKAYAGA